jgi:hypothetical protein
MTDPWPENITDDVVIVRGDKLLKRPPTQRELAKTAESAYRRGYQQGAHCALLAALDGVPLEYLLEEWADRDLARWRYSKDRVGGRPPPEPKHVRRKDKP